MTDGTITSQISWLEGFLKSIINPTTRCHQPSNWMNQQDDHKKGHLKMNPTQQASQIPKKQKSPPGAFSRQLTSVLAISWKTVAWTRCHLSVVWLSLFVALFCLSPRNKIAWMLKWKEDFPKQTTFLGSIHFKNSSDVIWGCLRSILVVRYCCWKTSSTTCYLGNPMKL